MQGALNAGGALQNDASAVVCHLAHELSQPLSTIESLAFYLQMILKDADARVAYHLDKLQEVVQQARWTLADAVHYLQATPSLPQVIDLNEFISESLNEGRHDAAIEARADLAPGPVPVCIDAEQMRHLLGNLLSFFRHVANPGSTVRVRTNLTRAEAHLELSTESAHFATEELGQIFEPFSPHLPAGFGLTLACAQRIVHAYGGRMDIHREPEGALSLFIALPEAQWASLAATNSASSAE